MHSFANFKNLYSNQRGAQETQACESGMVSTPQKADVCQFIEACHTYDENHRPLSSFKRENLDNWCLTKYVFDLI